MRSIYERRRPSGTTCWSFRRRRCWTWRTPGLRQLKELADSQGVELTYSLGLDKAYDISSPEPAVRERGMGYLSAIMDKVALMGGRLLSGVSYAGWACRRAS